MKIRKLKPFYFQKNTRYRAKELCRNIFLGNLSLNEGKISVGLPVLILEFLVTSRENQELKTSLTRFKVESEYMKIHIFELRKKEEIRE